MGEKEMTLAKMNVTTGGPYTYDISSHRFRELASMEAGSTPLRAAAANLVPVETTLLALARSLLDLYLLARTL